MFYPGRERKRGSLKLFNKRKKRQLTARKLVTTINPNFIVSEQYRTIRTNINFSTPDKSLQTILFTSSETGEGKSTSASNVAVVFAQEGKKVLVVDADMRRPTMHYTFQVNSAKGLSNLLVKHYLLKDVVKKTEVEGLHLITCGHLPSNPAELLSSQSMDELIKEMKESYDIIIFDAPPVLSVADAQILSNKCDGTIIVINSGSTEKESVIKANEALKKSKANIIGTILNNFKLDKAHSYYQYAQVEDLDSLVKSN